MPSLLTPIRSLATIVLEQSRLNPMDLVQVRFSPSARPQKPSLSPMLRAIRVHAASPSPSTTPSYRPSLALTTSRSAMIQEIVAQ